MIFKMMTIAGSVTGGMAATQECMDFCAEKGIVPEIELGRNLKVLVHYFILHEKFMKMQSLLFRN